MDLGEWEGLYKKQIKEHWPEIYGQWRGDRPAEFRLQSGRFPIRDVWQRAEAVWARVLGDAVAAGKARGGAEGAARRSRHTRDRPQRNQSGTEHRALLSTHQALSVFVRA